MACSSLVSYEMYGLESATTRNPAAVSCSDQYSGLWHSYDETVAGVNKRGKCGDAGRALGPLWDRAHSII